MSKLAEVIEPMAEVLGVAELIGRLILLGIADFPASLSTPVPFVLLWGRYFPDACSHIAITFLVAHHAPLMLQILVLF